MRVGCLSTMASVLLQNFSAPGRIIFGPNYGTQCNQRTSKKALLHAHAHTTTTTTKKKHGVMWRYTKLVEIHSNWCVSTTLPVISLQKQLS